LKVLAVSQPACAEEEAGQYCVEVLAQALEMEVLALQMVEVPAMAAVMEKYWPGSRGGGFWPSGSDGGRA